jgi:hypothetical protein
MAASIAAKEEAPSYSNLLQAQRTHMADKASMLVFKLIFSYVFIVEHLADNVLSGGTLFRPVQVMVRPGIN